jgi:small multidrug resistance pump
MSWLIAAPGMAANACARALIELAAMSPRTLPSLSNPMALFGNLRFWLGLALDGVAFALCAAALARLPLNIAHPVLTSGALASGPCVRC